MEIQPVETLLEWWKKDAKIDKTEGGAELLNIPMLHAKYVEQLILHEMHLKAKEIEYKKAKNIRVDYYRGRLNDPAKLQELGLPAYPYATLQGDMAAKLESDVELNKHIVRIALHEKAIKLCELVIKELNSRTYQLKAFLDHEHFIAGQ